MLLGRLNSWVRSTWTTDSNHVGIVVVDTKDAEEEEEEWMEDDDDDDGYNAVVVVVIVVGLGGARRMEMAYGWEGDMIRSATTDPNLFRAEN